MLAGATEATEPSCCKVTCALEASVFLLDDMVYHLADAGRLEDAERCSQKAYTLQKLITKYEQLSKICNAIP